MKKRSSPLNFEERKKIELLSKKGVSFREIGEEIGRSKNCIATEVRINGGRELYTAEKSQQRHKLANEKKIESLRKINKGNKVKYFLKQRIEILEMQVEILSDTIKELVKNGKKH